MTTPPDAPHPFPLPALATDGDPRLGALIADIGGRLRGVLHALPEEDFDALVRTMAGRQLRWEAGEAAGRVPERPVARLTSDP